MEFFIIHFQYFLKTPNILSASEMRNFWIDIRKEGAGVRIEAGKDTNGPRFMSKSWPSNRHNSWPPTHIAFAAWNSKIAYRFCGKRTEFD